MLSGSSLIDPFASGMPTCTNAPGTRGATPTTPSAPTTLTDPTGLFATLPMPIPCPFCTPFAQAVALRFQQAQAALAACARDSMSNLFSARNFAIAGFLLVAALLVCAISPSCRTDVGVIDGALDGIAEGVKWGINAIVHIAPVIGYAATVTWVADQLLKRGVQDCQVRLPYAYWNFRTNLACDTGILPPSGPPLFDAHHVFPKKYEKEFSQVSAFPNWIHNPRYGAWWFRPLHQATARAYNQAWCVFFSRWSDPHQYQVLRAGRVIMGAFGMAVRY